MPQGKAFALWSFLAQIINSILALMLVNTYVDGLDVDNNNWMQTLLLQVGAPAGRPARLAA